jgi:predicted ATPase
MNIRSIRLQRFRGFADAAVQLRPLTVLLGPNSAGKSAFGHALVAMAHAHKMFGSTPQASLTPRAADADEWPVDLGGTGDLRTHGHDGRTTVTLETRGGPVELGFGGLPDTDDLLLSWIDHPSGGQSAPSKVSSIPDPAAETIVTTGTSTTAVPIGMSIAARQSISLKRINAQQWQDERTNKPIQITLDGLLLKGARHDTGTDHVLSGAARQDLQLLLESLTYLRANRKRPSRAYRAEEGKLQPLGYAGEFAAAIMHRRGDEPVVYRVPPGIPNTVDEALAAPSEWGAMEQPLRMAIGRWLEHFALANRVDAIVVSRPDSRVRIRVGLAGQDQRDITEVGFGISQALPILVGGLLQAPDSLCIVDLPEAHLHPRPQASIADFFCSLALSGKNTLVETHSELFFHRLRLRAAMNPTLAEKIAVYFIDAPADGRCAIPRPVGLAFDDETRWPQGFLQEAWEIETQISAVREARRVRSK